MAAQEMTQRLEDALGSRQALRGLQIGTFHSLCLAMLPAPTMISNELALELARMFWQPMAAKAHPAAFWMKFPVSKAEPKHRNRKDLPITTQLWPKEVCWIWTMSCWHL